MLFKTCIYYITFKCNDSCEFCGIWDDKECQNVADAPGDQHFENLSAAKKNGAGMLSVTGGEPLLYDDLRQFLMNAKNLGFKIELTTNGILYEERAKELKGLIDKIFFSLDYPLEEEHDRSRGVECFNDVLTSVKHARDLGENPAVKFVMTRDSVRFLPEMGDLAQNLGVNVFVHHVYDFQGLHGFEAPTYAHIKYYLKRRNIVINLAEFDFLKNHGNKTFLPRCRADDATITYLPDGTRAAPCFYNRAGKQGRENVCSGCTRYPYMLPSFKLGVDRYRFLDWYSDWMNAKKEGIK